MCTLVYLIHLSACVSNFYISTTGRNINTAISILININRKNEEQHITSDKRIMRYTRILF